MNIVLVGHVCIDHNTTENATYTSWGSSVLYMAHYLHESQRLMSVVVSSYGPDLQQYISKIKLLPEQPDQSETLVYENDTRSLPRIWKAHKTDKAPAPALTPKITQILKEADIVIVAPLLPNYSSTYLKELINQTNSSALKMLCPQGYFRAIGQDGLVQPREFVEAPDVIPLFNLVVYSEEDHPKALQLAKAWTQTASDTSIIVTQGPGGAQIVEKGHASHVPTRPLSQEEIVDSVGCGDVFAITAAYHYRQSSNLEEAVSSAHESAARKLRGTPIK